MSVSLASCFVAGCDRTVKANGICSTHYTRMRVHGDVTRTLVPRIGSAEYVDRSVPCSIPGCERAARARGWCRLHWDRWRRNGDPLWQENHRATADMTLAERFWARVEIGLCWAWTGAADGGYGLFRADGVTVRAHRWAWAHLVGDVPAGLDLDHLCRNRACVNPDHLEPVTRAENTRRAALALWW